MDVGDIYSVEIPHSGGHEQAGTRPAVIVQAPQFQNQLPTIHPDSLNGLALTSVALVFQLRAIDKRKIKKRIGRLSESHLAQLREFVKALLPFA